uniref:hypothetical protein n=1 Tax=Kitasatospora sp. MBT63 TaxID=1444768 RepID=UPI000539AE3E
QPARVALGPLTEDQLWSARLGVADLPGGAVVEPSPVPQPWAGFDQAAAASPGCAPVVAALTEEPRARARAVYVIGNNTFGNRTTVDLGAFAPGEVPARFDALAAAVRDGCRELKVPTGAGNRTIRVREVAFEDAGVPAVAFALDSPTGAVASAGGFSTAVLYAAVGDNRVLFELGDDTAKSPALRADIVRAQIRKATARTAPPATATAG